MKYKIAMFPYGGEENPYQLLTKRILEKSYKVLPIKNKSLFPLLKYFKYKYLYLDWLSPYCINSNIFLSGIKSILFVIQIIILKIFKIKIIWNIHNLYDHEKRSHIVDKLLYKIMFFLSDKIRFFSESGKKSFLEYYNLKNNRKLLVISLPRYNDYYESCDFIDENIFNKIDENNHNILFFGLIREYKGINTLLKKLEFNKLNNNVNFIIAGKKQENFKLIDNNNITYFIQYINNENLKELFEKSTIIILPYERIMTSSAVYLCMYFKKPIICPPLPFFKEILGVNYPYFYNDMNEFYQIVNNLDKKMCKSIGEELYQKSLSLDYDFVLNEFNNKVFV
jgi:beta-1,4-mannosyltransferase